MSHANAALTPRARLRLAKLIVEDDWSVAVAAKMFMVSPVTARKWAARFRAEGPAGMADRSSRPRSMPTRTPPQTMKRIVKMRWRHRIGPAHIPAELGVAASTVMFGAVIETTYNSFIRIHVRRVFEAVITTPLSLADVVAGGYLWAPPPAGRAFE